MREGVRGGFAPRALMVVLLSLLMNSPVPVFSRWASNHRLQDKRPNIIFILTDDLGYGDLDVYGQRIIQTPNLDRMAAEGMRFTDFYSGSAVCGPARCSLMTGKNLGHSYIRTMSAPPDVPLRPQDTTVAEVLKTAGYQTALIGKWGLGNASTTGNPNRKGFDYSYAFLEHEEGAYYPTTMWRNGKQVAVPRGAYQQDLFTAEALRYIRRQKDQPFFLYLAYMVPHSPYEIPSDAPYSDRPWGQLDKNFAAMITYLDRDIARLFALLKELRLDDNTIVFFSSDNGPEVEDMFDSAGPLNGKKRQLYEGGIRVPLLVRWPGAINAGQVVRAPWAFWDFLPTAAELAGATAPRDIDGTSMLPTLLGREQPPHKPLYWEFRLKNDRGMLQAARMDQWKGLRIDDKNLGSKNSKDAIELYDLDADISETRNVAALHPDIVERIKNIFLTEHTDPEMSTNASSAVETGHQHSPSHR